MEFAYPPYAAAINPPDGAAAAPAPRRARSVRRAALSPPCAPTLLFLVVVAAALCAAPPVRFSRALSGRGALSWPPQRALRLALAYAPSAALPQRRTSFGHRSALCA